MIFNIKKNDFINNPSAYHKFATEDMFVYKLGYVIKDVFHSSSFNGYEFPPFLTDAETYVKGSLKEKKGLFLEDGGIGTLYLRYAYLSYSEKCVIEHQSKTIIFYPENKKADNNVERFFHEWGSKNRYDNYAIGKFVIPKGTEYYENFHGFVISSTLLWNGEYHLIKEIECGTFIKLKELCLGL